MQIQAMHLMQQSYAEEKNLNILKGYLYNQFKKQELFKILYKEKNHNACFKISYDKCSVNKKKSILSAA